MTVGTVRFSNQPEANHWAGTICGILVSTPYFQWTHEHAIHHATSGNLDRRGVGDVVTLTVKEYLSRSRWGRFTYRLYRHPLVIFGLGPHYLFLLSSRFVGKHSGPRERRGVYLTNAALFTLWGFLIWALGTAGLCAGLGSCTDHCGCFRRVAFLCPASVRRYLLATPQGLGLWDGSRDGQLVLQTAARAAMVQRQYRLSSYSPSVRENSQLQIGSLSSRESLFPTGTHPDVLEKPAVYEPKTVGRRPTTADRIR